MLSTLAQPWRGPVLLAGFVGAASHLSPSWFALWIVSGCAVMFLGGTGLAILARRQNVALRAVFDDGDYEISPLDVLSVPMLASAVKQLQAWRGENVESRLRIFIARGKTRAARLRFTTRCLVGDADVPSAILIPRPPESAEEYFEVLHEIGHATPQAMEAEVIAQLDPFFICGVAAVAWAAAGLSWLYAVWCVAWLGLRFSYWLTVRRTGIEAEVLADTFAYQALESNELPMKCVAAYARGWARNSSGAHSFSVHVQSRARLRCFNAQMAGNRLPVGVIQYSPAGLMATVALMLGPLLCPDNVWSAVAICVCILLVELAISAVCLSQASTKLRFVQ